MIQAPMLPEPADFDAQVRQPGTQWLAANPTALRPRALWTRYTPVLEAGYERLCGYAAMADFTGGTVDHYRSFTNHRALAYEWRNYRFASATMNSKKRAADERVLDPEEVRAGWFEILLPSLQMRATDRVPARLRSKAEHTLDRLGLADGERVIRWRRSWFELYQHGDLSIEGLRTVAPLIAEAVERDGNPSGKQGALQP
ncbi:MAG: hypothetical protein AW08_00565 [Candidatus Accumulibacter adjunctus]|uniref:Uncharacterized protein n=1 Tax=Candidatus Accumulibacter adjunctus TaxID=1454001 RepID=A0A011NXJ4_9PROT|nr:MAG: hypothetical protein AW08_00565 [Candidatus Accumulibacter adjunctus]